MFLFVYVSVYVGQLVVEITSSSCTDWSSDSRSIRSRHTVAERGGSLCHLGKENTVILVTPEPLFISDRRHCTRFEFADSGADALHHSRRFVAQNHWERPGPHPALGLIQVLTVCAANTCRNNLGTQQVAV